MSYEEYRRMKDAISSQEDFGNVIHLAIIRLDFPFIRYFVEINGYALDSYYHVMMTQREKEEIKWNLVKYLHWRGGDVFVTELIPQPYVKEYLRNQNVREFFLWLIWGKKFHLIGSHFYRELFDILV